MTDTLIPDASIQTRPPGPVEWRSAVVADVNRRERIVEVIAVPYNEETLVEYPPGSGKTIMESVLPGAFEGIDTRSHRITVNREHDYGKTIGIARNLYPSREEGLVAELRISPGPSGDDALGLAEDGAIGASVGMMVRKAPTDQRVVGNRRHIIRAFLDHIALVAIPAYGGAQVLSVRDALAPREPVLTPHLDEVQRWLESFQIPPGSEHK